MKGRGVTSQIMSSVRVTIVDWLQKFTSHLALSVGKYGVVCFFIQLNPSTPSKRGFLANISTHQ